MQLQPERLNEVHVFTEDVARLEVKGLSKIKSQSWSGIRLLSNQMISCYHNQPLHKQMYTIVYRELKHRQIGSASLNV